MRNRHAADRRRVAVKWASIAILVATVLLWEYLPASGLATRILVSLGALVVLLQAMQLSRYPFAVVFAALAVAYNPFVPLLAFAGPGPLSFVLLSTLPFAASLIWLSPGRTRLLLVRYVGRSEVSMSRARQSGPVLLLCLAGAAACAQAQVPSVETILAGMADARAENRNHLRPYKVTRSYQLFGPGNEDRAEVMADVTFVPPDLKRFSIRHTNGIGLAARIVRKCWSTRWIW